jgi:nucleoside 2-deoxyribosyltransferase
VTTESEFEKRIARMLEQLGVDYVRGEAIAGLRPDFVIKGPKGKTAIVEVKGWDSTGGNTARAVNQVEKYLQATGADLALIVLPELKRNFTDEGVVNEAGLLTVLQNWLSKEWTKYRRAPGTKPAKRKAQKSDRLIFAAMPFDRKYDDTFFVAMRYAAERVNAVCERVDRTEFSGDIVEEIKRLIRTSIAVIVDLSESKENVMYEAGFAHALNKPTVHICSTDLSLLPFDVRNWNTMSYNIGGTANLRRRLSARLSAMI